MLSDLIETTHIESFRLALFHLEGFDIQGCEWSIDQKNRVQLLNSERGLLGRSWVRGGLVYREDSA